MRRSAWLFPICIFFVSAAAAQATWADLAGPAAKSWPYWEQADPKNRQQIDHSAWNRFLSKYLVTDHPSGIYRVRYDEVPPKDRRALKDYLDRLIGLDVRTFNRAEQRAYWINLYNATVVQMVLENPTAPNVLKIDAGFFRKGPWRVKRMTIAGKWMSLDDIEHRILRPGWHDPRIHYVLNRASLGSPNLPPEAFTAENSERLLDAAARAYVNHSRGVSVKAGRLTVSSLYIWYPDDFGGEQGILDHLRRYATRALKNQLASIRHITYHTYDWRLNQP